MSDWKIGEAAVLMFIRKDENLLKHFGIKLQHDDVMANYNMEDDF